MNSAIFWDAISCSMKEVYWLSWVQSAFILKVELYVKQPPRSLSFQTIGCFFLVSYLAHSSNLKTQVVRSFETQINFCHTTQCRIPEDNTLHSFAFNKLWSRKCRVSPHQVWVLLRNKVCVEAHAGFHPRNNIDRILCEHCNSIIVWNDRPRSCHV